MNDETKKYLWDTDVSDHLFYKITYKLHLNRINKINNELYEKGEDKRASYIRLSDFIHNLNIKPDIYKEDISKAKIIIRKDKINKILNH